MRYMIIVKGDEDTDVGVMPGEDVFDAMADYSEKLSRAGAAGEIEVRRLREMEDLDPIEAAGRFRGLQGR